MNHVLFDKFIPVPSLWLQSNFSHTCSHRKWVISCLKWLIRPFAVWSYWTWYKTTVFFTYITHETSSNVLNSLKFMRTVYHFSQQWTLFVFRLSNNIVVMNVFMLYREMKFFICWLAYIARKPSYLHDMKSLCEFISSWSISYYYFK